MKPKLDDYRHAPGEGPDGYVPPDGSFYSDDSSFPTRVRIFRKALRVMLFSMVEPLPRSWKKQFQEDCKWIAGALDKMTNDERREAVRIAWEFYEQERKRGAK